MYHHNDYNNNFRKNHTKPAVHLAVSTTRTSNISTVASLYKMINSNHNGHASNISTVASL